MTSPLLLALLLCLPAENPAASRLAVIRQAPEFRLETQAGGTIGSDSFKGRVTLVGFIFTTCSGTCPATTHRMAQVEDELERRGLLKDGRVRLLSITLDPARDNPEALRRYMQLYDLDAANWTFATGPDAQVKQVIADWGMWVRPTANAQLDHPSRVFLVDQQGRIREIYDLAYFKTPWVIEDIQLLLNEPSRK